MQLDQDGVTDFGRQGTVGFMGLDLVKDLYIVEVDSLKDEGLTHQVIGSVKEVFGGKGGLVDLGKPGIILVNDGLFYQLHVSFVSCSAGSFLMEPL